MSNQPHLKCYTCNAPTWYLPDCNPCKERKAYQKQMLEQQERMRREQEERYRQQQQALWNQRVERERREREEQSLREYNERLDERQRKLDLQISQTQEKERQRKLEQELAEQRRKEAEERYLEHRRNHYVPPTPAPAPTKTTVKSTTVNNQKPTSKPQPVVQKSTQNKTSKQPTVKKENNGFAGLLLMGAAVLAAKWFADKSKKG